MPQAEPMSRPTNTDDLVKRLGRHGASEKEKGALEALSKEMIKIFRDERRLSHVPEAAALAPVTTYDGYQDLSRAFSNAIIHGTADGSILEPRLWQAFTLVLRCADSTKKADMELGRVMDSLQQRLKSAVEQAEPAAQYQLISTLSSVLDAMNDIKTVGLSKEAMHEPLLKQLNMLSQHSELRLAQAASYACQALHGIPNNESPYKALLRLTVAVIGAAANVAGAVSTMDPSKLFDGLTGLLQNLPDLVSSMVEVVRDLSSMVDSRGGTLDGVKFLQRQKSWYVALRFSDMLIQARAFVHLKAFLDEVPCRQDKDFLCGIYAQLEQAWMTGDPPARAEIEQLLDQALFPTGFKLAHGRVHEWAKVVADSLGRSNARGAAEPALRPQSSLPWKKKKYTNKILCCQREVEPLPADLLEHAWPRCVEAQAFYADVSLREYYLKSEELLLKVERLSGHRLPMTQCYVNLAIVEQSGCDSGRSEIGDAAQRPSQFTLSARLKVEDLGEEIKIPLPSLFHPRKCSDGHTRPPRRVLIRGRAGVGKTTLCKKIVHEFSRRPMNDEFREWKKLFDRVVWVPLRNLKGREGVSYNLEKLFLDEYFSQCSESAILAKALWSKCNDRTLGSDDNRTLFILDGLDEVSQELEPANKTFHFMQWLLDQPNAIITSRPGGKLPAGLAPLDCELETIGFFPDQVTAYIRNAFSDTNKVHEVQSFLQSHQLVQSLVRIPIQLDALCYTWNEDFRSASELNTMTTLYRAIELKLWRKDIPRLGKRRGGNLVTEDDIRKARTPAQIHPLVRDEIQLVQLLAFTGLYNDMVNFEENHRDNVYEHLRPLQLEASFDSILATLSFLRTSDASSKDPACQNYHFIHLTFQEFFAAQYFVEHWKCGTPLLCLALSDGRIKHITTQDFLRKEKYNARYDIFWRFVAGLFQAHGYREQLHHFFSMVDQEPRDLLGPVHQRLIMHCLSEADPSQDIPSYDPYREQLRQWMLFEFTLRRRSMLAADMEFPERILGASLQDDSDEVQLNVLYSLSSRATLSKDILQALMARLEHSDVRSMEAAAHALGYQSTLPTEIFQTLTHQLEDPDFHVRHTSAVALSGQSALPTEILQALAARLEDPEGRAREAAAYALGRQPALPEEIFQALAARLEDPEGFVRGATANALRLQPALTTDILQALAARLEDPEGIVRGAAAYALDRQPALPTKILQALAARLEDPVGRAREAAAAALSGQSALPIEILQALAARLEDPEGFVRGAAAYALGRQPALPEEIVQALTARSEQDLELKVRWQAVNALGGFLTLSDEQLYSFLSKDYTLDLDGLYALFLGISFRDYATLYIEGEDYRINLPEGSRKVPVNVFESAVKKAQRRSGVPLGRSLE